MPEKLQDVIALAKASPELQAAAARAAAEKVKSRSALIARRLEISDISLAKNVERWNARDKLIEKRKKAVEALARIDAELIEISAYRDGIARQYDFQQVEAQLSADPEFSEAIRKFKDELRDERESLLKTPLNAIPIRERHAVTDRVEIVGDEDQVRMLRRVVARSQALLDAWRGVDELAVTVADISELPARFQAIRDSLPAIDPQEAAR